MATGPLLSVRGSASRILPPDVGVLNCAVETIRATKAEALDAAGDTQRQLIVALAALGGTPGTGVERVPLSWLTRQVSSAPEEEFDHQQQKSIMTGRVIARAVIEIRLRDLELVGAVAAALEGFEDIGQQYASWMVDDDNPQWRAVRADAIHDALRQADDYAAALECRVARVEQVADAGMLADLSGAGLMAVPVSASGGRGFAMHGGGAPDLDPVPQVITATIDVRCVTETAGA